MNRSWFMQLLDRIFGWKAPFLPTLGLSQWWLLWGVNVSGFAVYWIGYAFGWWSASWLGHWFTFVFLLLAWTPLDMTHVVYLACEQGDHDNMRIVTRWQVLHLRRMPSIELHRIWVKEGKVLRRERLSAPPYTCQHCGAVSYHPKDLEYRFCGRCKRWADDEPAAFQVEKGPDES